MYNTRHSSVFSLLTRTNSILSRAIGTGTNPQAYTQLIVSFPCAILGDLIPQCVRSCSCHLVTRQLSTQCVYPGDQSDYLDYWDHEEPPNFISSKAILNSGSVYVYLDNTKHPSVFSHSLQPIRDCPLRGGT